MKLAPGFSLTNWLLLDTSYCLAPAQFMAGLNSHCLSNIGFLAFNWYTQLQWYKNTSGDGEVQAISLIPPHFNFLYTISYLGGGTRLYLSLRSNQSSHTVTGHLRGPWHPVFPP